MPYETYYNLPDEKKLRIEEAAINEFAIAGYDKATINNIILEAGIPKGSYYQYFKDKRDLFLYLILEVMSARKMTYMKDIFENAHEYDFYTLISKLFKAGVEFATQNPKMEKIGLWFLKNSNHEIFKEIFDQAQPMASDIYTGLLQAAIEKGEVRKDINIPYMSHLIPTIMTSSMEFTMKSIEDQEHIKYSDEKMLEAMDRIIETLRLILGTKSK